MWPGEMGLERRSEDFGQTLGRWGVPAGPLPGAAFPGASSLRDTAGLRAGSCRGAAAVIGHERHRA
jgi:phospholipid-binding lipoprotein MlaA